MTRTCIAIAAALCLTAATVHAQATHFTVSAASATQPSYSTPTSIDRTSPAASS